MGLREDVATLAARIATELKTKAAADHTHPDNYIILNSGAPLPPGTPDGTLVFRRQ